MNTIKIKLKGRNDTPIDEIVLRRCVRKDLKKLLAAQESILADFIRHNGRIGSIICNDDSWNNIIKVAEMIPVDPDKTLGHYIEQLENDLDALTKIFFSDSWNEEEQKYDPPSSGVAFDPSLIAQLNRFDYQGELSKSWDIVNQVPTQKTVVTKQKRKSANSAPSKKETVMN